MSDDAWLSDHLLGEDSEESRREAAARMAADPQLRLRVDGLQDLAEQLTALPQAAWEAVADRAAAAEPRPARRPGAGRGWAGRGWTGRGWTGRGWTITPPRPAAALAAAVLLFAAGIGIGVAVGGAGSGAGVTPATRALALRPLGATPARASGVAYVTSGDRLVLVTDHLPVTSPGRYYEAWLMTNTRQLVPLASFRVDPTGHARVALQLPAAPTSYRYIDVSLQSAAAGTAHSAQSVLRGPTAIG